MIGLEQRLAISAAALDHNDMIDPSCRNRLPATLLPLLAETSH